MFRIAKNIDTAFKQVRTFSLLVVFGCFILSVYALYYSHQVLRQSSKESSSFQMARCLRLLQRSEKTISR